MTGRTAPDQRDRASAPHAASGGRPRRRGLALVVAAAVLAVGVPAAGASVRTYGGSTGDEIPLALDLNLGGGVLAPLGRVTLAVPLRCPGPLEGFILRADARIVEAMNIPPGDVLLGERLPGGRFRASGARLANFGTAVGSVDETLTGRASGASVRGTYRAVVDLADDAGAPSPPCDTGAVRWSAKRTSKRFLAGRTRTGDALVIPLNRRRRWVRRAEIAGLLECGPAFEIFSTSVFSARLRRDGSFVDVDSYGEFFGRGRDEMRGRIRGRRATGTYRDRRSIPMPDGTRRTCDTGRVTWRAYAR